MKKVLIISYFFPPANFVGADRTEAWYRYLPDNQIFPIVITRQWNKNQRDLVDIVINNKLEITKSTQGEIHRLPFLASLRDKIATQYPKLFIFQKMLTLYELFFSNYLVSALPYSNFYAYAKKYLKENPDVKHVICSGRPFQTFFIGYLLKKEFPHIQWIADYRDEWGSHQNQPVTNFIQGFIFKLEKKSELKWTSNCAYFLSVSDYWIQSISKFIHKKGFTIKNGYIPQSNQIIQTNKSQNQLTVSYFGTLYSTQKIELFFNAVIDIIKTTQFPIHINLIGIEIIPAQKARVINMIKGYESFFHIIDRTTRDQLDQYYAQSDLLYLTGYDNIKGCYPVKVFDYFQKEIPILLCPPDNDVIEQFVRETNTGFIANNEQECKEILLNCIDLKKNRQEIKKDICYTAGETYSREYQTKLLAEIIHQN